MLQRQWTQSQGVLQTKPSDGLLAPKHQGLWPRCFEIKMLSLSCFFHQTRASVTKAFHRTVAVTHTMISMIKTTKLPRNYKRFSLNIGQYQDCLIGLFQKPNRGMGHFQYKHRLSWYMHTNSRCKDNALSWLFYLYNKSFTGNKTFYTETDPMLIFNPSKLF